MSNKKLTGEEPAIRRFFDEMSKKHNVDIDSLNIHMTAGQIYVMKIALLIFALGVYLCLSIILAAWVFNEFLDMRYEPAFWAILFIHYISLYAAIAYYSIFHQTKPPIK